MRHKQEHGYRMPLWQPSRGVKVPFNVFCNVDLFGIKLVNKKNNNEKLTTDGNNLDFDRAPPPTPQVGVWSVRGSDVTEYLLPWVGEAVLLSHLVSVFWQHDRMWASVAMLLCLTFSIVSLRLTRRWSCFHADGRELTIISTFYLNHWCVSSAEVTPGFKDSFSSLKI